MKRSANERIMSPEETAGDDRAAISRRRLLKAITAAGGAAVVSQFEPDKWTRPIVEIGVLPAHAQTSLMMTLSNGQKVFTGVNDCPAGSQTGSTNTVSFDYNDPDGKVTVGTVLLFSARFPNIEPEEFDVFNTPGITVAGDAFQGAISFQVCTVFGNDNEVTTWVRLRNAQDVLSNPLLITVTRPPGAAGADEAGLESLQQ